MKGRNGIKKCHNFLKARSNMVIRLFKNGNPWPNAQVRTFKKRSIQKRVRKALWDNPHSEKGRVQF